MDCQHKEVDYQTQIEFLFRILSSLDIITVLDIVSKWKFKRKVPLENPNNVFIERATIIKKGIEISLDHVLLAWCPRDSLRPDFIATIFGKVNRIPLQVITWNRSSVGFSEFIAGVGKFDSAEIALKAAKELSMSSRSVVSLQLSRFLDLFVKTEIRHPLYGMNSTVVVVHGKKYLSATEDREAMKTTLKLFGDIVDIHFHEKLGVRTSCLGVRTHELGPVCSVHYAFASQAYAAKYYLHGQYHKVILRFSIEVKEGQKEKHMMKLVKRHMIEFLDENRVVHT